LLSWAAVGAIGGIGRPRLAAGQDGATPGAPTAGAPAISPIASPIATPVDGDEAGEVIEVVRRPWREDEGEPAAGGRLRMLRPPAVRDDFSPVSFGQDFQVAVSYLDPLLRPDPSTLEPTPWLAERWDWDDGGRTITYRLRPDVRWHDGTPLTAADVRFSFTLYRDDRLSAVRNFFAGMAEIEAPDDLTLRVTLAEPDGSWLFNASTQLVFQRAQYLDHWTALPIGERSLAGYDWAANRPIGTGPWLLVDWDEDGVEFERNEAYWAGPPHFERFSIGWVETAADRLVAWEAGETDVVWPVRAAQVDRIEERRGRLYAADAASVMFAAFNFDNPERAVPDLFADVTVRRALSLAVDRERYAAEVFGGFVDATAAGTVAQPWAHDERLEAPKRDRRQAERLLTEAGWEDRDGNGTRQNAAGVPLSLTAIFQADGRPELGRVLASVADDLAAVGVDLTVEPLPEAEFRERWLETRAYDLIAYAYDLYPGFTDFDLYGSAWDIRFNPQGWNPGGYGNAAVDAAIADFLVAVAIDAQREALVRLQRAADEDLFGLWLGFPQELVLVGEELRGVRPNLLWPTADTREWWRT